MGDKSLINNDELMAQILDLANKKLKFANKEIRSVRALGDDESGTLLYHVEFFVSYSDEQLQELTNNAETESERENILDLADGGFELSAVYDGEKFRNAKYKGIDF